MALKPKYPPSWNVSKNFKMNFLEICFLSAITLHLEISTEITSAGQLKVLTKFIQILYINLYLTWALFVLLTVGTLEKCKKK